MDSDVSQLSKPCRTNVCLSRAILVNSHHSAEIDWQHFRYFPKSIKFKKRGGIFEEYLLLVPVCVIKILMVWRHSEKVGGRIGQDDGSTTTVWLHSFDFVSSSIHKVKSIFCKQTALEQYNFFYQRFIFLEDIYLGIHVHVPS